MIKNPRKKQIIKETQNIIQIMGFKEFSMNVIAQRLGIHRSTILYYFPDRENLLNEALKEYILTFSKELEKIKKENKSIKYKLDKFMKIHEEVLFNQKKICLCAALCSDFPSLPKSIQDQLLIYVQKNKDFIFDITNKRLKTDDLRGKSELFVDGLQGIMINCRNKNDIRGYYKSTNLLMKVLYGL